MSELGIRATPVRGGATSGAHTGHGPLLVHDRGFDRGITVDAAVVAARPRTG